MGNWYWLLEPLTLGTSLHAPLPPQAYWMRDSYPKLSFFLLAGGMIALLYTRNRKLWWFAAPVLLSAALYGLALTIGDAFPNFAALLALVVLFLGLGVTGYALVKSGAAWPAGLLFAACSIVTIGYQCLLSILLLTGSAI